METFSQVGVSPRQRGEAAVTGGLWGDLRVSACEQNLSLALCWRGQSAQSFWRTAGQCP